MSAPPAFRINAATSAISGLSMAMTTSAASNPRACAPGASFPRTRLVVAGLRVRVRVAFDLFFVASMSRQYSKLFAAFNIGQLGVALQCRVCECDTHFLIVVAMMCAVFRSEEHTSELQSLR